MAQKRFGPTDLCDYSPPESTHFMVVITGSSVKLSGSAGYVTNSYADENFTEEEELLTEDTFSVKKFKEILSPTKNTLVMRRHRKSLTPVNETF